MYGIIRKVDVVIAGAIGAVEMGVSIGFGSSPAIARRLTETESALGKLGISAELRTPGLFIRQFFVLIAIDTFLEILCSTGRLIATNEYLVEFVSTCRKVSLVEGSNDLQRLWIYPSTTEGISKATFRTSTIRTLKTISDWFFLQRHARTVLNGHSKLKGYD